MPRSPSNPLSGFLADLSEADRGLLTLALDLQMEGGRPLSDSEQQDLLEARILKQLEKAPGK